MPRVPKSGLGRAGGWASRRASPARPHAVSPPRPPALHDQAAAAATLPCLETALPWAVREQRDRWATGAEPTRKSGSRERDQRVGSSSRLPNAHPSLSTKSLAKGRRTTGTQLKSRSRRGGVRRRPWPSLQRWARTAIRRCGKLAAEKPVVAEAVWLAEAVLQTMIAVGIRSCKHATQLPTSTNMNTSKIENETWVSSVRRMASMVNLTKHFCSQLESELCHSERALWMQTATKNKQGSNVRVTAGKDESHDSMLDLMPRCRTRPSVQPFSCLVQLVWCWQTNNVSKYLRC